MNRNNIIKIWLFFLGVMLIMTLCNRSKYPTGGPHYYRNWKSYQIPFKPIEPISFVQAKKLPVYYEAFFNEHKQIIKFTKYRDGKVDFSVTYSYRPNGVIEEGHMIKSNGDTVIQSFDERGKRIKDN